MSYWRVRVKPTPRSYASDTWSVEFDARMFLGLTVS
jgi:hypothetical protein